MYPELLVRSSQGGRVPANMHRLHVALVIRNIRQFILQLGRASAFRDWHNFEASTNQSRTPQEPPSCETTLLKPRGGKTLYSSASKCSRCNGLILRDSTLRYWFWLEQYDTVTTLSKPGSKKKLHGFGDSTTLSSCLKRHCSKKPLGISWGTAQLFRASTVLSVPKKQGWSQSFRTVPEHKMERCVHVGGGGTIICLCTSNVPVYFDLSPCPANLLGLRLRNVHRQNHNVFILWVANIFEVVLAYGISRGQLTVVQMCPRRILHTVGRDMVNGDSSTNHGTTCKDSQH